MTGCGMGHQGRLRRGGDPILVTAQPKPPVRCKLLWSFRPRSTFPIASLSAWSCEYSPVYTAHTVLRKHGASLPTKWVPDALIPSLWCWCARVMVQARDGEARIPGGTAQYEKLKTNGRPASLLGLADPPPPKPTRKALAGCILVGQMAVIVCFDPGLRFSRMLLACPSPSTNHDASRPSLTEIWFAGKSCCWLTGVQEILPSLLPHRQPQERCVRTAPAAWC